MPTICLRTIIRFISITLLATTLLGCGSTSPSPENSAFAGLALTLQANSTDPTQNVALNPVGWYMKVQATNTYPALLTFAYIEPKSGPKTEVWISGASQYVKLQEGHIVASMGLPGLNWKSASAEPTWPEWAAVANARSQTYTRVRSTLPLYDFGIRELLELSPTPPPHVPLANLLAGASDEKARHWRWYREKVLSSPRATLPDAIFATARIQGSTLVVYSEQCLSEDFCIKMMRWPQLESEPQP